MTNTTFRKTSAAMAILTVAAFLSTSMPANAGPRDSKNNTRTSVNKNSNNNRNSNKNVNINNNSNKNVNVNSNKNVNINNNSRRDVDIDVDVDDGFHPVGTMLAVGATVAVTAAIVGSVTTSLPPACQVIVINGIGYQQCGSTWYQPQYVGSSVQYVVVTQPR